VEVRDSPDCKLPNVLSLSIALAFTPLPREATLYEASTYCERLRRPPLRVRAPSIDAENVFAAEDLFSLRRIFAFP